MRVTDITLEQPQITMLKTADGKWNFSSLGGKADGEIALPPSSGSAPGNLSVAKLNVTDGKLIVGKANSSAKPHVYDQVNITVTNFSPTSQFPFRLTAKLPAGGTADITGQAGPINATDAAKTPFEAKVKVNNMDIVASGFIDPASGHCRPRELRRNSEFQRQHGQSDRDLHGQQAAVLAERIACFQDGRHQAFGGC